MFEILRGSSSIKIFGAVGFIIFLNMITMYSCFLFGCYEFTFSNIFRVDLLCNACIDITYTIYKYQTDVYLMLGGMFLKSIGDFVLRSNPKED